MESLDEIHHNGIVHGDIKPSNIMFFKSDREWKFIDFEFAGKRDDNVIGYSAYYAAPEVVRAIVEKRDIKLSPSFDMFSVGVVGYELFSGKTLDFLSFRPV